MYFKVAPGVRVRVGSHGVRTSIGPRAARVHVGGGYRAGVSTGAGPVTLYHSVGGARRRRPRMVTASRSGSPVAARPATVAAYHRHATVSAKGVEAQTIAAGLQVLDDLHRHPVEAVSAPVAAEEPPVDGATIRDRHARAAVAGLGFWKRSQRRAALESASRAADAEIAQAEAERDRRRVAAQAELDERWRDLLANDADVVLATLVEAFEDNEMHAAPVSVDGSEASVAVFVPGEDIVPERKPATTAAGNVSLAKMTQTERAGVYRVAVCGHLLAVVREAFAVAPGLESARVAAVRVSPVDVYGRTHLDCLMAVTLTRAALDGVDWYSASSPDVVQQAGTHLAVNVSGRAQRLAPIDLAAEPDLAALIAAVEIDPAGGTGPR